MSALYRIGELEKQLLWRSKRCLMLEEMVRLLIIKKYGLGAERLSSQQLTLLELEPGVCSEEVAQESASAPNDATVPTPDETRKKPASRAVRAPLPKNLPRQERIIALPTRACTRCEEVGVSTAPAPTAIVEKGVLADSLVVEIVINKYLDHTPLYRQALRLGRDLGVEISQSTLSIRCSEPVSRSRGLWAR